MLVTVKLPHWLFLLFWLIFFLFFFLFFIFFILIYLFFSWCIKKLRRVILWKEIKKSHFIVRFIFTFYVVFFFFFFFSLIHLLYLILIILFELFVIHLFARNYSFLHFYSILIIFKHIYVTHWWNPNRYYHSGLVDLGVMAVKRYFMVLRVPEFEPHFKMQFSVIPRTPLIQYSLYSFNVFVKVVTDWFIDISEF